MINIAIIGYGNIGGRYLEGIINSEFNLEIYLVDPNIDKLKYKIEYLINKDLKHDIITHKSIDFLPKKLDIVIIATTSSVRKKILIKLINSASLKYLILEKIVFQNPSDFGFIKRILDQNKIKAWVNCPMRTYSIFKRIKEQISHNKLKLLVSGSNWGLACNSIHHIDLLSFLSDEDIYLFDIDGLDNAIIQSKRENYIEFRGMLIINTPNGHQLILHDSDKYSYYQKITIEFGINKYIINMEKDHYKLITENSTTDKKYHFPLQSEVSNKYVDELINSGTLTLPSFDTCMKYHEPMLKAFNMHYNFISNTEIEDCPIT